VDAAPRGPINFLKQLSLGHLCLDGEKIAISSVPRADGIWEHESSVLRAWALPITVESDKFSLAPAVIRGFRFRIGSTQFAVGSLAGEKNEHAPLLIIVILLLLFGGGGGYYAYGNYGGTGLGGVLGTVLVILLILWLLGVLR
jgi:hypothetical protein